MAAFGVEKEFYGKMPMPGMPSPLVNKYSEHCKKQHMPTRVKVLPKKNLAKAIEIALQKDGDVSKNVPILNMNEEVEVSKLNEKNFCCISHRWCSTEVKVDKFCELFLQFLSNGYLCAEDTCFEERTFYDHGSSWWGFLGKLMELVFSKKMDGAEAFLTYLASKTTLLGFKESKDKLKVDPDSLDELNEGMTALMMGKAQLQMDMTDIQESYMGDPLLEKIKRYLTFTIPIGATPQIKKADIAQMIKFVKDQKVAFQTSNPEKLYAQIYDVVQKCLNNLAVSKKLKENVFMKRYDDCLKYIDQMKNFKNKSNSFNGQDPIAMVTLLMLQNSQFEYFWADVFCTPQRKEDIQETLKAVKDGMAVFSIATVIVCPPFLVEKLVEYTAEPLADLIHQSKFDAKLNDWYKKFPFLTLNEKCLLFSDPAYFDRMWTLHEQGIGHTLYYWWQYLLGPFSKGPSGAKKTMTFRIDGMYANNYRAGLEQSSFETTMSRATAIFGLRAHGPGDGLSTMFQSNFATMQTGFAMDWELLATSLFNLDKEKSVSEQILCKKMKFYQSYLLQYSPAGAKYSYAWFKNPEHINHCFKFNDKWELMAGCVEKPEEHKPKPMKFTAKSGGEGKLGNEVVLRKCQIYEIHELTYDGLFAPSNQYVVYHLIGLRKSDLEKEPSPGYLITGEWTLPKFLADVRTDTVKVIKEHMPKKVDANMKKSYQMQFDYLRPTQDIMMVKSTNPKYDFTVVFGVIPHQMGEFSVNQIGNEKSQKNKKIDKVEFTMN